MDKEKLIKQANIYKAGNSGISHDEANFWLWEQNNRHVDFILELADKKIICISPKDIWCMDMSTAKESNVIDITDDYCTECKFRSKCTKIAVVEGVNSDEP